MARLGDKAAEQQFARFRDVFVEESAFTIPEARQTLICGIDHELKPTGLCDESNAAGRESARRLHEKSEAVETVSNGHVRCGL